MRIIVDQVPVGGREGGMERLAVVFPAYNEERHVGEAVRTALEPGVGHVVCVNDCSVDSTGAIIDDLASDSRVAARHHEVNQGKQAAVKHGLALALARSGTSAFAVLDSDMQLDPGLLPGPCRHIGPYDLVIGQDAIAEPAPPARSQDGVLQQRIGEPMGLCASTEGNGRTQAMVARVPPGVAGANACDRCPQEEASTCRLKAFAAGSRPLTAAFRTSRWRYARSPDDDFGGVFHVWTFPLGRHQTQEGEGRQEEGQGLQPAVQGRHLSYAPGRQRPRHEP